MATEIPIIGTEKEQKTFTRTILHYDMAREDLESRYSAFDEVDELFMSHINEESWPFQSMVFDPRVYTIILEKTSRLIGNRLRGKLIPREGGDVVRAQLLNELLSFQWDEVARLEQMPMIARWAMMDLNARKYGTSFGLARWHYERRNSKNEDGKKEKQVFFDGPIFVPLNNRDCLPDPSYSTIKNWFQHREYVTLEDLERINDAAQEDPTYKNLDQLKVSMDKESQEGGDRRDVNYNPRVKQIRGVSDQLGRDTYNKIIEIVHEYSNDRWVTIAPKHGVVLRDIENPYDHGQIPIVALKYYPVDDDIYGLSEIEPIQSLQKGINAIVNQYLDTSAMELYKPLQVNPKAVQLHTLEFGPGKKWYMDNPGKDVVPYETSTTSVTKFTQTYSFMVAALQNAMGAQSYGVSNVGQFDPEKTATEVRAIQVQKNVRDNFNQIFLAEALERQMMLWLMMDQQFVLSDPEQNRLVLRVSGRSKIEALKGLGLADSEPPVEGMDMLLGENLSDSEAQRQMDQMAVPRFPIEDEDGVIVPKMSLDETGELADVVLIDEDLTGNYDFKADVESMTVDEDGQARQAKNLAVNMVTNPQMLQILQQNGVMVKLRELFIDYLEDNGFKDADKFFEQGQPQQMQQPGQPPVQTSNVPEPQAINEQA